MQATQYLSAKVLNTAILVGANCGEGIYPPFGCEAVVNPDKPVCLNGCGGRFATQRG